MSHASSSFCPSTRSVAISLLGVCLIAISASTLAQEPGPPPVSMDELPEPDLAALEAPVAHQLGAMRDFVADQVSATGEVSPQLAESLGELGRLYLAYEMTAAAEQTFLLADRSNPRDFRWTYHLGYLYQLEGKLDLAARHYERALAIHPGVVPAMIRLGQVYAEDNRPEAAEWVLRESLEREPTSAAAQASLGELLVSQQRYREGEQLLLSALEAQPGADRLYYPLALAMRARGEEEAAREMMAKRGTVGVRPADPLIDGLTELAVGERVHLLRGRAAYQAGQFETAAEEFRSAAAVNPDSVPAHVNLGSTLGRLGNVEGAMAQYRKAIEVAPANTTALYNLGVLLLSRGETAAALEPLSAAVLYAPEDAGIRFQLAETLRRSDRPGDALLHYRKAVELEPPAELARFREAQVLADLGRYSDAKDRLEEGLALAPRSSLLALALARLLASAPDLSVRDGRRAVEILESAPIRRSLRSYETLAMAHAEAGDCDRAVEWQSQAWEAALEMDDESLAEKLEKGVEHYREVRPCRYPAEGGLGEGAKAGDAES